MLEIQSLTNTTAQEGEEERRIAVSVVRDVREELQSSDNCTHISRYLVYRYCKAYQDQR